jgi:two-component system, cell cycle response regulator
LQDAPRCLQKRKNDMVSSASFQYIVQKFDHLPSLPGVAIKLIKAIQKPEPDIREVVKLISSDTALSAKILKIVNSAFYGLVCKITSIDQAVKLLGLNAVENLSLCFILKKNFIKKRSDSLNLTYFWKDSLVGAIATKLLAERLKIKNTEDIFFLGLLKNIGSLTMAYLFPDQYSLVLSEVEKNKISFQDAETEVFGFDHAGPGALLTKSWGLPEAFHIPILHHHCVEGLPENYNEEIQIRTKLLHLSSLYVDLFHGEKPNQSLCLCYIKHFLDFYGFENLLNPAEIGKDIIEQTKEILPIFEIQFADENELECLLDIAQQELINMSMQMVSDMIGKDNEVKFLRQQVNIDAMTHLHNYKAFYETLDQEINRASRYKTHLSLIFADIDFFKSVNDTFGHAAGDQVLKAISQNLKTELRESDFIARYGGEEFAIILPETSVEDAFQVAERLRKKIEKMETCYDGRPIRVTMSFGIASFYQMSQASAELFVQLADNALYESKRQDRNRCSIATPNSNL